MNPHFTILRLLGLALLLSVVLLFVIPWIAPVDTWASHNPDALVQCGTHKDADGKITDPCTTCDIFVLIQNIVNFIWTTIVPGLAVIFLLYGGILMIVGARGEIQLGGGQKSSYQRGKKVLTNTVIGIVIVFVAWLAIDSLIKAVGGRIASDSPVQQGFKDFGPWNIINCAPGTAKQSTQTTPQPTQKPQFPSPGDVSGTTCPTCVRISVPTKPGACANSAQGQICMVDSILNSRLVQLNNSIISDGKLGYWRVTEAWPPTVQHQNPCHTNGTCVDANLLGGAAGNPAEIKYFVQKSQQSGLRAVYEVTTTARKDQLVAAGVPAGNVQVVPQITGEHFSVYMN